MFIQLIDLISFIAITAKCNPANHCNATVCGVIAQSDTVYWSELSGRKTGNPVFATVSLVLYKNPAKLTNRVEPLRRKGSTRYSVLSEIVVK